MDIEMKQMQNEEHLPNEEKLPNDIRHNVSMYKYEKPGMLNVNGNTLVFEFQEAPQINPDEYCSKMLYELIRTHTNDISYVSRQISYDVFLRYPSLVFNQPIPSCINGFKPGCREFINDLITLLGLPVGSTFTIRQYFTKTNADGISIIAIAKPISVTTY